MKFQLSLVALAIVGAGSVSATGFDLSEANLTKINRDKWQCNRCDTDITRGSLGASLVASGIDNAHATNSFGEDSEFTAALQSDISHQSNGGLLRVVADDLGLETGSGKVSYDTNEYGLQIGYNSQLHVDADNAQSLYRYDGYNLVNTGEKGTARLEQKRETWRLGAELRGDSWRSFASYKYQERTGNKAGATQINKLPVNFIKPVDASSKTIKAGAELFSDNWNSTLSYQGNLFENTPSAIYQEERGSLQALSPDNEAHQVTAQGQYRLDNTYISGLVAKGWLYQNDDYIDLTGVPSGITHLNGEVETLDSNIKVSSKLYQGLKLGFKASYRERDNKSPTHVFHAIEFDELSGKAIQSVALDTKKSRYQFDANYRITKGLRLSGGFEHTDEERNHSVREKTSEDRIFAKIKYSQLASWKFTLGGEYGGRDGSEYQTMLTTSSEDNPLLRKYHLANRDRTQVKLKVSHAPLDSMTVDMHYRYAMDDYSESALGLSESTDNGYDFALGYQASTELDLYAFAGQQQIVSTQLGSQNFGKADWRANVEDTFTHIGIGMRYSGLMQDKLRVGLDYNYSESESETDINTQWGDYISWSHNVMLFATYAVNQHSKIKAQYRYERHYDTDYRNLAVDTISGLSTLGEMDSDYNAHQLMVTFSHSL